jgi:hypothetical protein
LVHFDYNCILSATDPEWEKKHADSVLGAARGYGYDEAPFFDCRKNLAGALAGLVQAINDSSATNPLYFIIAGPMEVPFRAIEKSAPDKRRFVYCISHSRWNDGYASDYKFAFTKRNVIGQDVHWIQIQDQNRLLSFGRYGRPAAPEEFAPYFWMRDSHDAKVRFLWDRMLVSTRPDPSDAGMAWFLTTGDEDCTSAKLKRLLDEHQLPSPTAGRRQIRVEAENFRHLTGFMVEGRKDKEASHQLNLLATGNTGSIRTRIDEPFMARAARYDVVIHHREALTQRSHYTFSINDVPSGGAWDSASSNWTNHVIRAVELRMGDEVMLNVKGAPCRLDYVQFNLLNPGEPQVPRP